MSDRPRRALDDPGEPEENGVPDAMRRDTDAQRATPARARRGDPAGESEEVHTPDVAGVPGTSSSAGSTSPRPDRHRGPLWALMLGLLAIAVALATTTIPRSSAKPSTARPVSSGRTLVCPASQSSSTLAAGSRVGSLLVGTDPGSLGSVNVPAFSNIGTGTGFIRSTAGQAQPSGSAWSEESGMTTLSPCLGASTTGTVTVPDPSKSDVVVVNPETTAASVDVSLLGPSGEISAAGTRGITISPGSASVLPLSVWVRETSPLTAVVQASTGRVVVAARTWTGRGRETIPMAPATTTPLLPAIPAGVSSSTLLISNPGSTRAVVGVTALPIRRPFTPAGADAIDVAPRSTIEVDLSRELAGEAMSLKLVSDQPITARMLVAGRRGTTDYAVIGPGSQGRVLEQTLGPDGTLELSNPGGETVTFKAVLMREDGKTVSLSDTIEAGSTWTHVLPGRGHLRVEASGPIIGGVVSKAGLAVLPLGAQTTRATGRTIRVAPQLR